jgi:hypothetical protein
MRINRLRRLYFTWRTLQVNHEGQITERFTRAIDQLGHGMIRKTHDLRYVLAVSTSSKASLAPPPQGKTKHIEGLGDLWPTLP